MTSQEIKVEISDDSDLTEGVLELEDHNYNQTTSSTVTPSSSSAPKSQAGPGPDKPDQTLAKMYCQLANARRKAQVERSLGPKEKDECDIYSKLLAIKLRRLPRNERMIYMNKIDGLFVERIYKNRNCETSCPRISFPSASSFPVSHSPSTAAQSSSSDHIINIIIPELPSYAHTSYSEPIVTITSPNEHSLETGDITQNKVRQKVKKRRRQRRYWMTNIHKGRTR